MQWCIEGNLFTSVAPLPEYKEMYAHKKKEKKILDQRIHFSLI